ncbi:hypothetical protein [Undibacterium sp. KW1]|uniref:hypothetical protein n=1 Tax=Undibacterium sp. KW1 TaxID=2058624 RepID=UPI0013896C3E|nr:hypothetical protein [Undibacterium sp. KW1]
MTVSPSYPQQALWQKSANWAGIILLHLFLLLGLRQIHGRYVAKQDGLAYLDISMVQPVTKSLPKTRPETQPEVVRSPRTLAPGLPSVRENSKPISANSTPEPQTLPVTDVPATQVATESNSASLDLDALRRGAVANDKKQRLKEPALAFSQPVTELRMEEKFGRDVADAKRKNCMNAYSEGARIGNVAISGLLVAGVIVADTVSGKGCKW